MARRRRGRGKRRVIETMDFSSLGCSVSYLCFVLRSLVCSYLVYLFLSASVLVLGVSNGI